MTNTLFTMATLVRFVETFTAVLFTEFVFALTTGGAIDLSTPEGVSAILTALGAAALLALRRAWAVAKEGAK